jgi:hypothetical protein
VKVENGLVLHRWVIAGQVLGKRFLLIKRDMIVAGRELENELSQI